MIADDILDGLPASARSPLATELARVPFVKVQNVADYFYRGTEQEEWDTADFPSVMSPWPMAWLEYKTSAYSNSGGHHVALYPFRWGVMIRCGELTDRDRQIHCEAFRRLPVGARTRADFDLQHALRDIMAARWYLSLYVMTPDVPSLAGVFGLMLDEAGRASQHACIRAVGAPGIPAGSNVPRPPDHITDNFSKIMEVGPRLVCLLALSFCHCRNVHLHTEEMSRALMKKRAARGRAPVSRFHVLEIAPMRRVLDDARVGAQGSLQRALHICRGHFKDYREGDGLFGRVHGLYWWDMQARGTARRGEVRKDYDVAVGETAVTRTARKVAESPEGNETNIIDGA